MAAHRQTLEATLRSGFGEQRLTRAHPNQLNRVTLVPREPLQLTPTVLVEWRDGGFGLDVLHPDWWPLSLGGRPLGAGFHPLADGARFTAGNTEVSLHVAQRQWPVDLERERALLSRDDHAAWSIYADELLASEDPLGGVLSRSATPDVAFLLELSPLVAQRRLAFTADQRGLWREVTFVHDVRTGGLISGVIDAVLSHPIAWFARQVTLDLRPGGRSTRQGVLAQARASAADVARAAGPHLEVLCVPRHVSLASPREGVTVR